MATRKPQVGWRHSNADQDLYAGLFRFGYHERIHNAPHGKVTEHWTKFVNDLFNTQEDFMGKEKTSVINNAMLEDGHCQNLSGFEGDLAEPDATIKMILNKIQEEEERKKAKENTVKKLVRPKPCCGSFTQESLIFRWGS